MLVWRVDAYGGTGVHDYAVHSLLLGLYWARSRGGRGGLKTKNKKGGGGGIRAAKGRGAGDDDWEWVLLLDVADDGDGSLSGCHICDGVVAVMVSRRGAPGAPVDVDGSAQGLEYWEDGLGRHVVPMQVAQVLLSEGQVGRG